VNASASTESATNDPGPAPRTGRPLQLTWLVARREIRLRAKTRVFVINAAIMLIAVALAVALPAILSGQSHPDRVGVVGGGTTASGIVAEAGRLSGGRAVAVAEPSLAAAEAALRRGDLSAVLVPGQEIVVKQVPLGGVSGDIATLAQLSGLSRLIQTVPGAAAAVTRGVTLPVRGLEPPSTSLSSRVTGQATEVLVWVLISAYGSQIALGIGEEKSSRVVEVLLSAVRPVQLLIGKVLGIGLLALGQVVGMVVVFVIAGFAPGSSLVHGATLGVVIAGGVFVVLGYAFYCTAFAAAGSLVSRQSDVNSTILPVQLPLIVAYALSFTVIKPTARISSSTCSATCRHVADRDAGAVRGGRRPGLAGRAVRGGVRRGHGVDGPDRDPDLRELHPAHRPAHPARPGHPGEPGEPEHQVTRLAGRRPPGPRRVRADAARRPGECAAG
jgi:ABC-2 type transport system permease protein